MKKITIIGTGYVGLVSGAGLADFGNEVVCVDINKEKVGQLKEGIIPFYEPGLNELVARNVQAGRLSFSTDIGECVKRSDVIFIAVWTPMGDDGEADLSAVENASGVIGENLTGYKVVSTKSTVPIGTGELIRSIISKSAKKDAEFDIISNPEFLREGAAIRDFMIPNRVVIGTDSERALTLIKDVYRPLFINETPMVITDIKTAETIKYAANAFLAVKISYVNELANLCDENDADIHTVTRAMALDGRISPKFLHPGPGFGGSCFPKDTQALVHQAKDKGVNLQVVAAAIKANELQQGKVIEKLERLMNNNFDCKTVAVLGLAFKANTDDVRQSPAIPLLAFLSGKGCAVKAYDPEASKNMAKLFPDVNYCSSMEDTVAGADAAVVMTEWHEFRGMDLERVGKQMNEKVLLDARNLLSPKELNRIGFRFDNIGRSSVR
ncbi:MAG: UDP-glucose/GDP-mannose dehydrogenase family protein [Candidatus Marinimicrobia bacterium]|jgi:UDPglucose 6-dehydrogenase|nr:UDP-glucose/GDP-mannose dehydrogenase family protein [Candidatus Neomarinimicrobiota bacterium]MDP6593655.1 UDP-glucose/GDP-mannose dehydrogenase family protein [Candidatus Neomarinimicrobiota bacterium]MDP6836205.1 UDP-glucose/GDP-mannose dehydrogenase family protein [Candidatus Neomarinimicrobiota bacterium]